MTLEEKKIAVYDKSMELNKLQAETQARVEELNAELADLNEQIAKEEE